MCFHFLTQLLEVLFVVLGLLTVISDVQYVHDLQAHKIRDVTLFCWHNWNKIIKDIYRVNHDNLQAYKRKEVALLAREFTQFSIFSRLLRVISMIMMIKEEKS